MSRQVKESIKAVLMNAHTFAGLRIRLLRDPSLQSSQVSPFSGACHWRSSCDCGPFAHYLVLRRAEGYRVVLLNSNPVRASEI